MQAAVTERTDNLTTASPKPNRHAAYSKVQDLRKRPIRGLWERNGRYYAQMTVEDPVSGIKQVKRVPLENVTSAAQARDKFQDLLAQRRKGVLPVLKRTPPVRRLRKKIF